LTLRTAFRPPVLLTERLRLRPRTAADLDANLAMDLDPEVHRYVYIHGPPDPVVHRRELARQIEQGWPAPEGALWVVEERAQPGFLGWCAVFPLQHTQQIELGYRYARQAWGRGIATEAGRAVLTHAFRELAIDPLVGVTHPDNRQSRHVLEKLGFRYRGLAWYYDTHLTLYRLSRDQFLAEPRD
jgi:RimJ/RimL family protein N-acetyltransferase